MTDPNFKPRRRPDVRAEPVAGELVLYDPAGGRAAYLNATAAAIWALCDGERTVKDMTEYLSREIGGEGIATDVDATVERFRAAGLVG